MGFCKHNWLECNSSNNLVKEGDVISVQGKGRLKINKNLGENKKNKIKLQIEILK